jgi:hypothetical protein
MKSTWLLLLFIIAFTLPSQAQIGTVVDVITKLIPNITEGITKVLQSSKKGKVDTAVVKNLQKNVNTDLDKFYKQAEVDQTNIDYLNKWFEQTLTLSGYIASMQTLCTPEILEGLDANSSETTNRAIIMVFESDWAHFQSQIKQLEVITRVGDNAALQALMTKFSVNMSDNLKSLDSDIAFAAKVDSRTSKADLQTYIRTLHNSKVLKEIDAIQEEMKSLHVNLTSYISAFSASLKKAADAKPVTGN